MSNHSMYRPLFEADPQIAAAIDNETRRQHEGLELIASENFVSEAVLEAAGSVFTNKYAEGYPGQAVLRWMRVHRRGGEPGAHRAKQLFNAEYANVQPHAGSQANMAAYAAVLQPGDTILGLESGARRTSHARPSSELLRQDLQDRSLRRHERDGNHRLRRTRAPCRKRTPQDDHRRRQRLSAHHRLRPHAPDRR